jgi:DNA (cytosine-5)-methyltransferase 1
MLHALDFFCGAGGLTRGFLDAGIKVVAGLDINAECKRTYEENNSPSKFIQCDLRKVTAADIRRHVGAIPRDQLVFAGCAPCQPFSKLNRTGVHNKTLLSDFGRLVADFKPAYVVIENVPGLVKIKGNSTYRRFVRRLQKLGYTLACGTLDAKYYGVPQNRRRWVVIGALGQAPALPVRTHGTASRPLQTVRHAISRFPRIAAGETLLSVPNHRAAEISKKNLQRLRATPKNGGSRTQWPEDLVLNCHADDYEGHSDVYGRMNWDQPAPALTCRCYSISNGRYGHPEQHRAISLREAASIQTFPDNFRFYGPSQREIGTQIGNAVPVRLARKLAETLLSLSRTRAVKADAVESLNALTVRNRVHRSKNRT